MGSTFSFKRAPIKNKSIASSQKSKKSLKVVHKSTQSSERLIDQERIDLILEKIKKYGYETLTDVEKDDLFKASQKD